MTQRSGAGIIVAIDTPDAERAEALAGECRAAAAVKLGLEFFAAQGPSGVRRVGQAGAPLFLDLKLHDIPNTVARAAGALGALGARYVTMHAAGGAEMLRAGVEGLEAAPRPAGAGAPLALAITVLTSDAEAAPDVLGRRARLAAEAGCGGVVCAAVDLPTIVGAAPDLLRVVPGIRPPGAAADDQARVATPAAAGAAGADILVIGRPVTAAPHPAEAAAALLTT